MHSAIDVPIPGLLASELDDFAARTTTLPERMLSKRVPRQGSAKTDELQEFRRIKHDGTLKERRELLKRPGVFDKLVGRHVHMALIAMHEEPPDLQRSTAAREIAWLALLLRRASPILAEFVTMRTELDLAILEERWKAAQCFTDKVIKRFGWSITLLERQIALSWRTKNHDALQSLLVKIIGSEQNDLIKFVACALYFKHNPILPADYFKKLFSNNITNVKANTEAEAFLRLLIDKGEISTLTDQRVLCSVLLNLGSLALYDQYEYLLALLQRIDISSLSSDAAPARDTLATVAKETGDSRLATLIAPKGCRRHTIGSVLTGIGLIHCETALDDYYLAQLNLVVRDLVDGKQDPVHKLSNHACETARHFNHPFTIASQALLDVLTGTSNDQHLTQCALRFEDVGVGRAKGDSRAVADAEPSIGAIEQALCAHNLVRALTAFNDYVHFCVSSGVSTDSAACVLEIASRVPLFLPRLRCNAEIVAKLSAASMITINDIIVVVALMHVGTSAMELSIRIEELLSSLGVRKPSQLIPRLHCRDVVTFQFFHQCCTTDVLEQVPSAGADESEIRDERLAVLRFLAAEYPKLSQTVGEEIGRLVKAQKLNSLFIIVEESRLRVNTEALGAKIKLLEKDGYSESLPLDLVESYLLTVIGLFLLDEDHGLDAELSNRIRHGKLRERLFSPFLRNSIIDAGGNIVAALGALSTVDVENGAQSCADAISVLRDLEQQVRATIDDFVNERAHLRLEEVSWRGFPGLLSSKVSPHGLISVSRVKESAWRLLSTDIAGLPPGTLIDSDEAYDMVIDKIWSAIDGELREVKHHIVTYTQPGLTEALNQCEDRLRKLNVQFDADRFTHCKYDIVNVCAEISRWFCRPAKADFPESPLGEILELATKAVETCGSTKIDLAVNEACKTLIIRSAIVGDVYDLFFLLISNAAKHGIRKGKAALRIYVSAEGASITVRNSCDSSGPAKACEANALIDGYITKGINSALNREGKSGLVKVLRLLRKILGTQTPHINVGIQNGDFCVTFSVVLP